MKFLKSIRDMFYPTKDDDMFDVSMKGLMTAMILGNVTILIIWTIEWFR